MCESEAHVVLPKWQFERFNIKARSLNQEIQFLSGGNQQKVILARWLMRSPLVLLLDDPTAGIDIGAKAEIHELIRALARDGVTVIVVSSEFPELLDLCHRVLVVRDGRIIREVDPCLRHGGSASRHDDGK